MCRFSSRFRVMSLPFLSFIVGPGVGVTARSESFFFIPTNSESIGSEEARGRAACGCDMSGREGGREGGHGRGQSDRSIGSGGRRKGKSHAGPGRPTQSVYVATPKDGANSRAIYEYFTRVPKSQMPSLASNRMEAVGQQATSSVPDPKSAGAAPKSPSCTPAVNDSQGYSISFRLLYMQLEQS